MNAYRIRNWAQNFENNRSKTVAKLSWVPVPNGHDGEGFAVIMAHKDAAEIFAAWILILQIASRCSERGVLIREGGRPHDSASLAMRTRASAKWFDKALPILVEVGWVEMFAVACQATDTQLTPACHPTDEERKKEGSEGTSEGVAFSQWFKSLLPATFNPPSNWQRNWSDEYDSMIRLDGRSKDTIKRVCEWARADPFWSSNFMSPAKLRTRKDGVQYFDIFLEKMKSTNQPTEPQPTGAYDAPSLI
jgi:hypothetical protein